MAEEKAGPETSTDAVETMRRLEGIVASAMDGIITINDKQLIILFNPAAERMFGLSSKEAMGEHISRFIPQRFRATHAAHIHRFAQTGVTNRQMGSLGTVSGLRANGEEFPIEASISQVDVGGARLATVILRDITERKAAEDALLESQRRMEGIVESAMDALITVDDQERIILFNPAAERMFGVDAADAQGSPIERFIPERFRDGHSVHIRQFKETGVTNRRMGALGAVSGRRANGEEFPVEASISQVTVGGAKLATVILRDIAERKANEEARHLLAREVDHRAKNVLAVVQALVSLTRASTKEDFIAAVRGRIAALGRAHSLLAQNRWEGADLMQIVTEEAAAYQGSGQVRPAGPNIALSANSVQPVSLLIHELATNAMKYGALSVASGRVDVSWRVLPTSELELCWTESGGPAVNEPVAKGFGSTLVTEVATRQLGGAIRSTWLPSGLEVVATMPAGAYRSESGRVAAAGSPESPAEATVGRPGRLLVVEDDSLIAMQVCTEMSSLGWEIIGPAATIEEAMRLIAEDRPDAAVLDINLNGRMVYPLARHLRKMGVQFVFCSGYEEVEEDFRTNLLLHKPVNVELLDSELRRPREAA
jgi:PAS domain S-box-containing protein